MIMEKPSRPQRNRRHSRRAWPPEDDMHQSRPAKRLFTPEIKRMLKDWLIRRRENPYPSRDEKKRLAVETGLTYTQICNWFANWRRKLKNSERERVRRSWGHLIKNYNTNAKGNVEQFSISSEDSIWEENGRMRRSDDESHDEGDSSAAELEGLRRQHYESAYGQSCYGETAQLDEGNYYAVTTALPATVQYYKHFRPTEQTTQRPMDNGACTNASSSATDYTYQANKTKYKQKMMEKYMREECEQVDEQNMQAAAASGSSMPGGAELSKWLESAAKFTPNKNNYFIEWNSKRSKLERKQCYKQPQRATLLTPAAAPLQIAYASIHHHKDELDAAEALANLAFNCRQRMLDATVAMQPSINVGSS